MELMQCEFNDIKQNIKGNYNFKDVRLDFWHGSDDWQNMIVKIKRTGFYKLTKSDNTIKVVKL
jgi:hypothetical protein